MTMPQGWTIDPTADTITFFEAPANDAAIVVNEYAGTTRNVTDIWALGAWSNAYGFPTEVEFFSDRLVFAGTPSQPQTLWFSRSGNYVNFGKSQPIQEDDAIAATLNARSVNAIQDIVPLDKLILLTTGGEWKTTGGQDDVIAPMTIGFKPQSYHGASGVPSLVIGNTALFVQDRGYVVRDLGYQFDVDGYVGGDITVFSSHLLEGKPIKEWTFQQVPHSIVWVVRQDGTLLALTYMREQEVIGWTPQETDGFVESVCTVPEGGEDALYAIIRRTVGGEQRRFVERMETRLIDDMRAALFLDSALTYDGRGDPAVALRLNLVGDGGWSIGDELALVADFGVTAVFDAGMVGDQVMLNYRDGEQLRLEVVSYSAPASIRVRPLRNVPADLQGSAVRDWAIARNTMAGLDHLEGREVGILADGFVHRRLVVTGGSITLDRPHALVHAGLPYVADFETLDISAAGGNTVRDRTKRIGKVSLLVQDTRSIFAGPDPDHLDEYEPRSVEGYESAPDMQQGLVELRISGTWTTGGRVFVRQSDPLPITILAAIPDVEFGP
jgi:hypothetical protein